MANLIDDYIRRKQMLQNANSIYNIGGHSLNIPMSNDLKAGLYNTYLGGTYSPWYKPNFTLGDSSPIYQNGATPGTQGMYGAEIKYPMTAVNQNFGVVPVIDAEVVGDTIGASAGAGANASATNATANGGKLAGLFGSLRGKFSGLNNISLRNLLKNGKIGDPELLGWDTKNGISLLGGNVGKLYAGGKLLGDTFGTLQNYGRMTNLDRDTGDIKSEILSSAASNPLASQYLTQDEISLLNKLKRGSYSPEGTEFGSQMGATGLGALKGGLTGYITAGTPGAIAGALGGAFKSGSEARNNAKSQANERLEALLQSLNDASAQYKSMRRPNFTGLGIQGRFQDMYR